MATCLSQIKILSSTLPPLVIYQFHLRDSKALNETETKQRKISFY